MNRTLKRLEETLTHYPVKLEIERYSETDLNSAYLAILHLEGKNMGKFLGYGRTIEHAISNALSEHESATATLSE